MSSIVSTLPSSTITSMEIWVGLIGAWATSGFALLVVAILTIRLMKAPAGTARMQEVARYIKEGAGGFLKAEFLALTGFVIAIALALGISSVSTNASVAKNWKTMICFLVGAIVSAITGLIGMAVSVRANVRTTAAAMDAPAGAPKGRNGLNAALRVAFSSGAVMGLSVVGLGLLVLSIVYVIFQDFDVVSGFGFGASSIALFARVGGGIFTKAADVGSDLVGKVENDIPEDDPRNPGVIADNVGDNVGDVAGMGADLFESYVGSIIAAGALGTYNVTITVNTITPLAALPFWVAATGIVCSIVGVFAVQTREKEGQTKDQQQNSLLWAIRGGIMLAAILVIGATVAPVLLLGFTLHVWGCIIIGLAAGVMIGFATEYATSFTYQPVKGIAAAGRTGPATVVIQGLAVGMWSTVPPVLIIVATILACIYLGGVYGVSLAAVGMLSTLGVTLATDAYGPVADNAGGIAEMCELPPQVRERTDALDALGNTTAATGKGFAIGSAVLTALALMTAYTQRVNLTAIDLVTDIATIPGLLIGATLPFLFAALTMLAVGKAAMEMVDEIRRQFRTIDGLLEGRPGVVADYRRCVDISTRGSLRQMIMPGVIAIVSPIIVGLLLGSKALGGLLAGSIVTGFLLAVTMANAGGAWDNAKKFVEAGGMRGIRKGSELHKAVVVGDTVGDPFKDTSGPSLNILIKLMSVMSLMLGPLFNTAEPFTAPNWWIGAIIIGAICLFGLIAYLCMLRNRVKNQKKQLADMEELQPISNAPTHDEHEESSVHPDEPRDSDVDRLVNSA